LRECGESAEALKVLPLQITVQLVGDEGLLEAPFHLTIQAVGTFVNALALVRHFFEVADGRLL
jgi:hypothetical protein